MTELLPCILSGKYIYALALEMASAVNRHCANWIGTVSLRTGACLEEREDVELVCDVLSHLVETDTHEADVRTTQLVRRLLHANTPPFTS